MTSVIMLDDCHPSTTCRSLQFGLEQPYIIFFGFPQKREMRGKSHQVRNPPVFHFKVLFLLKPRIRNMALKV